MEGIIKFTPLLFSVALAYMYIILGTSKITNAQTLSPAEVANESTASEINLTLEETSTRALNVTNSKNESDTVLDLDVPVRTSQENRTAERLDVLLFDNNSTKPNNQTSPNGTALPVDSTTGNETSADQNATPWPTNPNKTIEITPTAASEEFANDTTLIVDVPGTRYSGNNMTSSGNNTFLLQNTTLPQNSTDEVTFNDSYTYTPSDANGSELVLLENQTLGVTLLPSNSSEDDVNRTPKLETEIDLPTTKQSVTNQTTPSPSVTITSYTDAFNNDASSENETLESDIPLNGSIPTMVPTSTLQIDSSLNVTETSTTMSTTLQTDSGFDRTASKTSRTRPDATKGRSWSNTLKNKLTTPIFPANATYDAKGTSPKTTLSNTMPRTLHYTVGESENSTVIPTTAVTLLFIPYAYGNESTTSTTEYTTPTATTTSPTMLSAMSTPTTEWKTFTTTQKTTVTDFNQSEVDKVKEKPAKKKAYEELLPEEKENTVTVVFNNLSGNLTENFEEMFCYFISQIMNNYLKMWSSLKEPENELSSGPEQADVTEQNIHFLKPTPYFSKDFEVIVVTFYVSSISPSGTLTVFPAEVVMQNLKDVQNQIQKELKLNTTDIFIGVHPNLDSVKPREERQLFSHFEPLFIALIAVAATCLFTLLIAIICFKCCQKGVQYSADREKLNQERTYSLRGQDLRPECEILREERQMAEKDGGMMNGEKKHPLRQNGDEGWVVPIGDMPLEEQNAPAIQDTRL